MTPTRLRECLQSLHWPTTTLAEVLRCEAGTVLAWYHGNEAVPEVIASWLQATSAAVTAIPVPDGWSDTEHQIDLPRFVVDDAPKRGWFGK